jgi:hypothetical protein
MPQVNELRVLTFAAALTALAMLSACGGGGGETSSSTPAPASTGAGSSAPAPAPGTQPPAAPTPAPGTTPPSPAPAPGTTPPSPAPLPAPVPTPAPAPLPTLALQKLEVAQTHIVPPQGRTWSLDKTYELHLTGARDALLLVTPDRRDLVEPKVQVLRGDTVLGEVALEPPSALPVTEDNGAAYAADVWSARLPAALLSPGVSVRVTATNVQPSAATALKVGADTSFTVRTLPFYVYGANGTNSLPLSQTTQPNATIRSILADTWPMARLDIGNHPAGAVYWPEVVIPPRASHEAFVARSKDDQRDGYDTMSAVLSIIQAMRAANGEAPLSLQYYAPLVMLDAGGTYRSPGGGLGGGSAGTGDWSYAGVFIHEQGHAFGLPHANDGYVAGTYPYANGSLHGSSWAWDSVANLLRSPSMPATASNRGACTTGARVIDAQGRCIKQDPMQSGSGDQPAGVQYAMFSDFSLARMQQYMEERAHADASFASGYKTWNASTSTWANAGTATAQGGLYGFDNGYPVQRDVPVRTIVVTYSMAGTPGATQVYTPISSIGNLMRTIDPTNAGERAQIVPNTGIYNWYCRNSGCDYTLRVTYADGSTFHAVIPRGFRTWFAESAPIDPASTDPLSSKSMRLWVTNVPGVKTVSKVEVLDTPMVWQGLPASPAVVVSRAF